MQKKDFSEVKKLLGVQERPYDEQEENGRYAEPALDRVSTPAISCSS